MRTEGGDEDYSHVRVGIIGGGIAGVSAAHALRKRLHHCQIELLEAGFPERDTIASPLNFVETEGAGGDATSTSSWKAATARNGNSIVPGASFFVFSQPSSLRQILTDAMTEYWEAQKEFWKVALRNPSDPAVVGRLQDFANVPPYFALHLGACLGPSASSTERWSFLRFVQQYLYYTVLNTERAAVRGRQLCDLAKANRNIYLELLENASTEVKLGTKAIFSPGSILPEAIQRLWVAPTSIGHSQGFLSVHRTLDSAQQALDMVRSMGEEAEMVEWEDAKLLEPRLSQLPISPLFVVRRPNDFTASCGECVRAMIRQGNFPYRAGVHVETIEYKPKQQVFNVRTGDGSIYEFDVLVLAAGIHTPLLASQLNVAEYCPTYPLRGFSLTVFTNTTTDDESSPASTPKPNLLRQPFKVDSIYCSSVSPTMARWVGFGELVGYQGTKIPSLAPAILARYAKAVFPDCSPTTNTTVEGTTAAAIQESVLPCFRALSPDDLPLVGPIPKIPGLFLHTGHGSLGWTLGLATGEVLASHVESFLKSADSAQASSQVVTLSDGTSIDAAPLLPARFVS